MIHARKWVCYSTSITTQRCRFKTQDVNVVVPQGELQMHMDRHLAEQFAAEDELAWQANIGEAKTHVKVSDE